MTRHPFQSVRRAWSMRLPPFGSQGIPVRHGGFETCFDGATDQVGRTATRFRDIVEEAKCRAKS